MPDYRLVSNGYVAADLDEGEMVGIFRNLKLLKTDCNVDFGLVMKTHLAVEVLRDVNRLTGKSFQNWLAVNFEGGRGHIADVVRDVLHYLNGRIGHAQLQTSISVHENKLHSVARMKAGSYSPSARVAGNEVFLRQGEAVYDYDLYRLMAGIGPLAVGRLFLLVGGESYYG